MKKRLTLIIAAVLCLLCAMATVMTVSAAELPDSSDKIGTMTVVYLRDNGKGDGHDYANAVGTLEDAYMMLDLSKDCTIVVCDVFTQINSTFSIGKENAYTGSVTVTSCYGGYDYRKIGAKFEFDPFRWLCWGETKFEYIDFHTPGTNLLVVGQHNPVTLGAEVNISGDQMTGGNVAKSFCILGGYQKQRNEQDPAVPPMEDNRDTHITVMSGKYLYIVPFSRQLGGNTYMGTAHIKIGGNAEVGVLHGSAVGSNTEVGNVEIEFTDNASISSFYGCTETGIKAKSFTFNWKSGSVKTRFQWECEFSSAADITFSGDTTLNASAAVKGEANYTTIATLFDKIGNADKDPAYTAPANPNTQKPGDDILKAPVTSKTPAPPSGGTEPEDTTPVTDNKPTETKPVTEKETKPVFTRAPRDEASTDAPGADSGNTSSDGGNNTLIIIIAAVAAVAVIAVVAVVILKKKKA